MRKYFEFMENTIAKGYASPAPPVCTPGKQWYLPHFPVINLKKNSKLRVVFDSSAEKQGVSLNKVLWTGPDQLNSLTGVLLRFRHSPIAVMRDLEQFFHSFFVTKEHRDYLRFFWGDQFSDTPQEWYSNVHLFGNRSSPAIANYALKCTLNYCRKRVSADVKDLIQNVFYCDDALISLDDPEQTVSVIQELTEWRIITERRTPFEVQHQFP